MKAYLESNLTCSQCGAPLYVGADDVLRNTSASSDCTCSGEFERPSIELKELKPKDSKAAATEPAKAADDGDSGKDAAIKDDPVGKPVEAKPVKKTSKK